MTLREILANKNIHADTYAMAAISYIFNAFGDIVRSKDYWPFGKILNFDWHIISDTNLAITCAELCLERAREKHNENDESVETQINNNESITTSYSGNELSDQLRLLSKRLNKVIDKLNSINTSNTNINNVSEEVISKISNI